MIGTTLSHYRITARLGAGGMGEVYRASDTKLDREVAIKVLPAELAHDAERLARFEREAKLLASLNHANIAHVYGFERATLPDGTAAHFLAMELVEGEDLAERLKRGAIPVEDAIEIAKQIAEALEEAHEHGIVHRDLKPANVKQTPDGKVKVLDFGLAKAYAVEAASGSSADLSQSPTLAHAGTQAGMILGTAAYMSPEQARGKLVDKRTDIWAFGVVLYEMLTGRPLFAGETVSDVLAGVLKLEPDWALLPAAVPASVARLLRRCLEKSPRERLRDIGDARQALSGKEEDERFAGARSQPVATASAVWAALLGLLIGAGLVAAAFRWMAATPAVTPLTQLSITLPPGAAFGVASYPGHGLAVSRDGRMVAYSGARENRLYVRDLATLEARALDVAGQQPFFSPDGEWLGYFGDGALSKVPVSGGRPVTLVPSLPNASWLRASWSDDGRIVFDTWNAGLRVVGADGGPVRVLTEPQGEWHLAPNVIPGTNSVLFFSQTRESTRIESISLDADQRTTLLEQASQPLYLNSGHLLFVREGGLMLAPFDKRSLELTGPAVPVPLEVMPDHPNVSAPVPQLAASANGTLVYVPSAISGSPSSTLVWVDRAGKEEEIGSVPFAWPHFDLAPDGRRLVLSGRSGGVVRFALFDLEQGMLTPLREDVADYPPMPVWSHDGSRLFYSRFGTHEGEILAQGLDGGALEPLAKVVGTWVAPRSASRDGRYLVFSLYHPESGGDIWYIDLAADEGATTAKSFLATASDEQSPALSPRGDWLAYVSDEGGEYAVLLRRFPGGESKLRVTSGDCRAPAWGPDGDELFVECSGGRRVMALSVATQPTLRVSEPRLLFEGGFSGSADIGASFSVSPDGHRFLMVRRERPLRESRELIVVQGWFAEVARLTAARDR